MAIKRNFIYSTKGAHDKAHTHKKRTARKNQGILTLKVKRSLKKPLRLQREHRMVDLG